MEESDNLLLKCINPKKRELSFALIIYNENQLKLLPEDVCNVKLGFVITKAKDTSKMVKIFEERKIKGCLVSPWLNKKVIDEKKKVLCLDPKQWYHIIPNVSCALYEFNKQISVDNWFRYIAGLINGTRILVIEEKYCKDIQVAWDAFKKEFKDSMEDLCVCTLIKKGGGEVVEKK